jgi:hypothetical protein
MRREDKRSWKLVNYRMQNTQPVVLVTNGMRIKHVTDT